MWWKRSGARVASDSHGRVGSDRHSGVPEAADEYDVYLGQIGPRLHTGATAEDIAAFLTDVEEVRMGLGPSAAEASLLASTSAPVQ